MLRPPRTSALGNRSGAQSPQVRKISRVCRTSRNPCSALTLGPAFDCRAFDLDGLATRATHQVVVVSAAAGPVDGLPVVGAQHVNVTVGRHRLQRAVDGGQSDCLPRLGQHRMYAIATWVDACQAGSTKDRVRRASMVRTASVAAMSRPGARTRVSTGVK